MSRGTSSDHGHTATTRDIAQAAGVSEAVDYQRFGSKDQLFFAAMNHRGADLDQLLGPKVSLEDARRHLQAAVVCQGEHFAQVIPLLLHVMTHPSFDPASLAQAQPGGPAVIPEALADRLAAPARRGEIAMPHRPRPLGFWWASRTTGPLRRMHGGSPRGIRDLKELVEIVWQGLRPRGR